MPKAYFRIVFILPSLLLPGHKTRVNVQSEACSYLKNTIVMFKEISFGKSLDAILRNGNNI